MAEHSVLESHLTGVSTSISQQSELLLVHDFAGLRRVQRKHQLRDLDELRVLPRRRGLELSGPGDHSGAGYAVQHQVVRDVLEDDVLLRPADLVFPIFTDFGDA